MDGIDMPCIKEHNIYGRETHMRRTRINKSAYDIASNGLQMT